MTIRILSVGKIREKYLEEGIREYAKRIGRYCKLEISSVADEKTPDGAPAAEEEKILAKEGERLLCLIRDRDYVIALDIGGTALDSPGMAEKLIGLMAHGRSTVDFVIGGSLGLHKSVLDRADYRLSFSKMTFPHQLMRLILAEQIYRCFRIINHEPYHK